jgi:hypothetical protein
LARLLDLDSLSAYDYDDVVVFQVQVQPPREPRRVVTVAVRGEQRVEQVSPDQASIGDLIQVRLRRHGRDPVCEIHDDAGDLERGLAFVSRVGAGNAEHGVPGDGRPQSRRMQKRFERHALMDAPRGHLTGLIEILLGDRSAGLEARHQHVYVGQRRAECFIQESRVGGRPVVDDLIAEAVDDLSGHLLPLSPEPACDRTECFDVGRRCYSPSGGGLTGHQFGCDRL